MSEIIDGDINKDVEPFNPLVPNFSDDEVRAYQKFGKVKDWRYNPLDGRPLTTGLSNFKNLFRKPTFSDWVILIILLLVVIGSWAYYHDVKLCHETLNNLPNVCAQYISTGNQGGVGNNTNQNPLTRNTSLVIQYSNISNLTIVNTIVNNSS